MFPSARFIPSGRQTDPSDYTIRLSTCQGLFSIVRPILSHPNSVVNYFSHISENFSVCNIRLVLRIVAHFGDFVKYKSSSSKNFFVKSFLRCKCENFFENFSEIFVPTGPGRFCQVLFLRSSKKTPLILYHIFRVLVKRFLRKTFFIFREKLLDFTPRICYNIYVR